MQPERGNFKGQHQSSQQNQGTERTKGHKEALTRISQRVMLRRTVVAEVKTRLYQVQTDKQLLQEGGCRREKSKKDLEVKTVMKQSMLDFIHSVQLMKQNRKTSQNLGDPGAFITGEMWHKERRTFVGCEVVPRTRIHNLRSK